MLVSFNLPPRLREGEDRPRKRPIAYEEEHLEHRGGGGPAPEVEEAEQVGPVWTEQEASTRSADSQLRGIQSSSGDPSQQKS